MASSQKNDRFQAPFKVPFFTADQNCRSEKNEKQVQGKMYRLSTEIFFDRNHFVEKNQTQLTLITYDIAVQISQIVIISAKTTGTVSS